MRLNDLRYPTLRQNCFVEEVLGNTSFGRSTRKAGPPRIPGKSGAYPVYSKLYLLYFSKSMFLLPLPRIKSNPNSKLFALFEIVKSLDILKPAIPICCK
jgi:hypothetical protein